MIPVQPHFPFPGSPLPHGDVQRPGAPIIPQQRIMAGANLGHTVLMTPAGGPGVGSTASADTGGNRTTAALMLSRPPVMLSNGQGVGAWRL